MTLAIIIPAHNEEKRISATLKAYSDYFGRLSREDGLKYLILVVINASKDNTEKVVKEYARKNKNIKHLNLIKGGKGYAIVEGFKYALEKKYDLIGFVDADMATKPEDFHELCSHLNGSDGIIGNRWNNMSVISRKQSFKRRVASRIFNFIVKSMFFMSYEDTQCGAKLFKSEVLENINKKVLITHWAFDVNLLYLCKINNFKILEYPTVWEDQADSKVNIIKTSLKMLFGIIRLRIIYSPFRDFIRLYNAMPEVLKINHKIVS